jgi:Ni/Fe-hydrogenase subunit HybB-like protein
MLEKALDGSKKYWAWVCFLGIFALTGVYWYIQQFNYGLGLTGLHRDVSWGLYIGQFTFLVGVAASAVMLVIPYYLHDFKKFGKIVILGEFLAIAAVTMCILFIFVDMGQPMRITNVILHPTPGSVMFWDSVVLMGYLFINVLVGWVTLSADRKGIAPPKWIKPWIYLSIPWAISIHTVTAFLYSGVPGRHFWLTAVMAPRFLASAFAGGPSLLIILALIVRKVSKFDVGKDVIQAISRIVAYAMFANVFLLAMEFFTAFYSGIPGHQYPFAYLYATDGSSSVAPLMWTSAIFAVISLVMLWVPAIRRKEGLLALACVMLFASLWIDKGFGLIIGGFVPNMFEEVNPYWPTYPETMITIGVWSIGFLVLTFLYKIAITVREQTAGVEIDH